MKKLKELIKQRDELDKQIIELYKEIYIRDYSQYVLNIVANHYRISPLDIISNRRHNYIMGARKIYCLAMRDKGYTYEYIAAKINRTHGAIISLTRTLTPEEQIIYNKLFNNETNKKNYGKD